MSTHPPIIACDFDGTIVVQAYPEIGEPIFETIDELLRLQREYAAKLILWTNREGVFLEKAVAYCASIGLYFDAVNDNLPEITEAFGNNCRKVFANVYWDDRQMYLPHLNHPDIPLELRPPKKCTYPAGISLKPDGVHELDPCLYETIEEHTNVTLSIMSCVNCGHTEFSWVKQDTTESTYSDSREKQPF